MRIGIVGAGAIGGWLGVRLARDGHDVSVLARGETLQVLREEGWQLQSGEETVHAAVHASDDPGELGPQDVVLICLKGPALTALAPQIAQLLGPDTIVIPMMNGVPWWFLLDAEGPLGRTELKSVDPTGEIAALIPFSQVIGAVVHCSAAVPVPGKVVLKAGNRLILGEPGGGTSARLRDVCAMFSQAGFDAEECGQVRYEIWYKLWGNMTMNPISAMTGATCDRMLDDELVAGFVLNVMAEAQEIGAAIGCAISESGEDRNAVTRRLGAFKTSMLQDAEAGKPLEIDQLLSAPREIAAKLNIDTPNLDALTGLARLFGRVHGLYPAG